MCQFTCKVPGVGSRAKALVATMIYDKSGQGGVGPSVGIGHGENVVERSGYETKTIGSDGQ